MTRSNCTNTNLATTHTPPQDHGGGYYVVATNRSGPVNRVAVGFQGHYSRFTPPGA